MTEKKKLEKALKKIPWDERRMEVNEHTPPRRTTPPHKTKSK